MHAKYGRIILLCYGGRTMAFYKNVAPSLRDGCIFLATFSKSIFVLMLSDLADLTPGAFYDNHHPCKNGIALF